MRKRKSERARRAKRDSGSAENEEEEKYRLWLIVSGFVLSFVSTFCCYSGGLGIMTSLLFVLFRVFSSPILPSLLNLSPLDGLFDSDS